MPKAKSKHFTRKQMLIAAGLITVAVVALVWYRKRQQANAPTAAYSTDTSGKLPGQNYLPATGTSGASQLGDGVAAPPPTTPPPVTQPPDGSNDQPPPAGAWEYHCATAPGGILPNGQCGWEWIVDPNADGSCPYGSLYFGKCRSLSAPPGAPPQPGTSGAGAQPTADVLSSIGSMAPNRPPADQSLLAPTATADAAVRFLQVTQYIGRGNPSNPWQYGAVASEPGGTAPNSSGQGKPIHRITPPTYPVHSLS